MNYLKKLKERNELLDIANNIMNIYIKISDRLYSKATGKYSMVDKMNIYDDGISYVYFVDAYDRSAGRDTFFVSKDKLEKLAIKELRKQKINKIEK